MIVDKLNLQGASKDEIQKAILEKKQKALMKYAYKSKIGFNLDQDNKVLLSIENKLKSRRVRNVSDFNRNSVRLTQLDHPMSPAANYASFRDQSPWSTTNKDFYKSSPAQDNKTYKRNFKKSTPFTQWSNAFFHNGVFFNPPVSGI